MKKNRSNSELLADTLRETKKGLDEHGICMGQVLSKNAYGSKEGGILVCIEIEISKFYPRKGINMGPNRKMTVSEQEIAKWSSIISKAANGIDRLKAYLASRTLGREFGETASSYFERKGLADFVNWSQKRIVESQPHTGQERRAS